MCGVRSRDDPSYPLVVLRVRNTIRPSPRRLVVPAQLPFRRHQIRLSPSLSCVCTYMRKRRRTEAATEDPARKTSERTGRRRRRTMPQGHANERPKQNTRNTANIATLHVTTKKIPLTSWNGASIQRAWPLPGRVQMGRASVCSIERGPHPSFVRQSDDLSAECCKLSFLQGSACRSYGKTTADSGTEALHTPPVLWSLCSSVSPAKQPARPRQRSRSAAKPSPSVGNPPIRPRTATASALRPRTARQPARRA